MLNFTKRRQHCDAYRLLRFVAANLLATSAFILILYNASQQNQLFLYVIGFLVICCISYAYLNKNRKFDPFAPSPVLVTLLFLYSYASAAYLLNHGTTLRGEVVYPETLTKYFASCLLALSGILLATAVSELKPWRVAPPAFLKRNLDDKAFLRRMFFWTALISLPLLPALKRAFDFRSAQPYAETAFLSRVLYAEQGASQGLREYFTYEAPLCLVLALSVLLLFRGRGLLRILGIVLLLLHVATMFLSGARTSLAIILIMLLTFYHYRISRLKPISIIALLAFGLLMTNVVSLLRFTSNPSEMLEAAKESLTSETTNVATISQSGELLTAQNLMRLIQGIDSGESGYTYGGSLISEFLTFLPKAILTSRPLTLAEDYVDTFYPGVLESGGGFGFFFVMEGYWAGGYLGVFFLCFLYGYLIDRLYSAFLPLAQFDATALLYGIALFPLAMFSVRSGLVISIKTALMDVAPICLVMALPDMLGKLPKSRQIGR